MCSKSNTGNIHTGTSDFFRENGILSILRIQRPAPLPWNTMVAGVSSAGRTGFASLRIIRGRPMSAGFGGIPGSVEPFHGRYATSPTSRSPGTGRAGYRSWGPGFRCPGGRECILSPPGQPVNFWLKKSCPGNPDTGHSPPAGAESFMDPFSTVHMKNY